MQVNRGDETGVTVANLLESAPGEVGSDVHPLPERRNLSVVASIDTQRMRLAGYMSDMLSVELDSTFTSPSVRGANSLESVKGSDERRGNFGRSRFSFQKSELSQDRISDLAISAIESSRAA